MVEKAEFRGSKIVNNVSSIRTSIRSVLHLEPREVEPASCLSRIKGSIRHALRGGVFIGLSVISSLSYALGLGQLNTLSSLNEPFEAEIELLSTNSEELQTVSVQLASPEQFKSAGVDRLYQLSKLKFEILEDPSRGNFLRITSQEPMREPYLNFLLEVNWAKGRLVREYTALIDPPTYDSGSRVAQTDTPSRIDELPIAETIPVEAPETTETQSDFTISQLPDATLVTDEQVESGEVVPAGRASSTTTSQPAQTTNRSTSQNATSSTGTYTTRSGDTLWGIAQSKRPNASLSVQQMMISLLNANPEAFSNNNINNLKTGQILRIPDTRSVDQITKEEAIALVKEHNTLWDDYRQGLAENVPFRPEGAVTSSGTVDESLPIAETQPIGEPELKLVSAPPEAETESQETATEEQTANVGADQEGNDLSLLQDELAVVQEQLSSREGENQELKSRLQETEEIIVLLKQQVELKNDELAALQSKLREADQAKTDEQAAATGSETEAAPETTEPEAEVAVAETPEEAEPSEEKQGLLDDTEETAAGEQAEMPVEETAESPAAEVPAEEASIDDLLAELDAEEAAGQETVYVNNDDFVAPDNRDESIYAEYNEPAVNLSGQTGETQYPSTDSSATDEGESVEDQLLAELEGPAIDAPEVQPETGILDKIKAFIPADIAAKVPGGVNSVLGILAGLLLLLLLGVFKLFGGKKEEEAETIDLLNPDELDAQADQKLDEGVTLETTETQSQDDDADFETALANESENDETSLASDVLDQTSDSLEDVEEALSGDVDKSDEQSELDDLDFSLDLDDDSADVELNETQASTLHAESEEDVETTNVTGLDDLDLDDLNEEEISLSEMANLEDTLENIKPLLDETEEELEENDPLEEVNISLAYEQFDKAERLVKEAIANNPEEVGYKLRLLEVHYAANNPSAFEEAARDLHTATDGQGHLWDSAESMWAEMVPERGLFDTAEDSAPVASEADSGGNTSGLAAGGLIAGMSAAGALALDSLTDQEEDETTTSSEESIDTLSTESLDELPDLDLEESASLLERAVEESDALDSDLSLESLPDFDLDTASSSDESLELAGASEDAIDEDLELDIDLEQTQTDMADAVADLEASLDENLAIAQDDEITDEAETDDNSTADPLSFEAETEADDFDLLNSDALSDTDTSSDEAELGELELDADAIDEIEPAAGIEESDALSIEADDEPLDISSAEVDTDSSLLDEEALDSEDVFDITGSDETESALTLDDVGGELDLDLTLGAESLDIDAPLDEDDASMLKETGQDEIEAQDLSLDMPDLDLAALDETNSDGLTSASDAFELPTELDDDAGTFSLETTQPGEDIADALDEIASEGDAEIDMLDITAAGLTSGLEGTDEQDAQELFELSNELKSDDDSVLSDLASSVTDMELSDAIDAFQPAESAETASSEPSSELAGLSLDPNLLGGELDGDDELDALARSLEDTISGLNDGLDDMDFEFDANGELEKTLSSTLGASADLSHDFETEADEIDTKLNLAKAYIELGDAEGARDILNEVSQEGNDQQKQDAQELLSQLG